MLLSLIADWSTRFVYVSFDQECGWTRCLSSDLPGRPTRRGTLTPRSSRCPASLLAWLGWRVYLCD
eukprot:10618928-Heterocapsa_arctica.AAC.1